MAASGRREVFETMRKGVKYLLNHDLLREDSVAMALRRIGVPSYERCYNFFVGRECECLDLGWKEVQKIISDGTAGAIAKNQGEKAYVGGNRRSQESQAQTQAPKQSERKRNASATSSTSP